MSGILNGAIVPAGLMETSRAFVVFCGDVDAPFLKILKDGYRHCFLLLNDGENWVAFEPLLHCTEVFVLPTPADFDLPAWLSAQKLKVVETRIRRKRRIAFPVALFSCVASIKRVLGIRAITIITPYQLYRYLQKEKNSWAA